MAIVRLFTVYHPKFKLIDDQLVIFGGMSNNFYIGSAFLFVNMSKHFKFSFDRFSPKKCVEAPQKNLQINQM